MCVTGFRFPQRTLAQQGFHVSLKNLFQDRFEAVTNTGRQHNELKPEKTMIYL